MLVIDGEIACSPAPKVRYKQLDLRAMTRHCAVDAHASPLLTECRQCLRGVVVLIMKMDRVAEMESSPLPDGKMAAIGLSVDVPLSMFSLLTVLANRTIYAGYACLRCLQFTRIRQFISRLQCLQLHC